MPDRLAGAPALPAPCTRPGIACLVAGQRSPRPSPSPESLSGRYPFDFKGFHAAAAAGFVLGTLIAFPLPTLVRPLPPRR